MVLRRLGYWIGSALIIAGSLYGQSFNRSLISIRPETTQSPVGQLRFYEAGTPTNYVGFKAPTSIAADVMWQLPPADGSSGNCLGWVSAGVIDWVTCAGGGGGGGVLSIDGISGALTFVDDTNVTIGPSGTQMIITWVGALTKVRQHAATQYTDQSNTITTGTQSFAAATALIVPTSPGASPTASGSIMYDSTSHTFEIGVNGANKTVAMIDGNIATATALLNDPVDCEVAGEFARGIAANGNLTCAAPAGGGNVNVSLPTSSGNIPYWITTGGSLHNVGLGYSTTGAVNTLVQLDSLGTGTVVGLITKSAAAINYQKNADSRSMLVFRGTDTSPTQDMVQFRNYGDTVVLSAIDKDGKFTGNSATATALATDPTACQGGQFVTDISATGVLTCAPGSSGFVSGPASTSVGWVPVWNNSSGTQVSGGYAIQTMVPTASALIATDALMGFRAYDKGGTVYHCGGYGVKADGVTDDLAALNACEAALPDSGGTLVLPCGDMITSATWEIGNGTVTGTHSTKFGILVRGCGSKGSTSGVEGDADAQRGSSRIRCTGCTLTTKTISDISNATPIVVTSNGHGLETQDVLLINGAGRNGSCNNDNSANGTWTVHRVDGNNLELRGSAGNGTFVGACAGTIYVGSPVIRIAGPILNVHLEDLQIEGNSPEGQSLSTVSTTGAAIGVEYRHNSDGGMRRVGINRTTILGLDLRTANVTNSSVAYFNCNSRFDQLQVTTNMHPRSSALRITGYDVTNGADSCSNKFYGLNLAFGGGLGSYGVEEGFSDNNFMEHVQIGGATSGGGSSWRRVETKTYPGVMPAANAIHTLITSNTTWPVTNQGIGRSLWLPNYGETETEADPNDNNNMANVPFTNMGMRGFTDRGRFFNTYNQNRDGAAATPSYSFASDVNTGMYHSGADDIGFAAGGVKRASINTIIMSHGTGAGIGWEDRDGGNSWEWYAAGGLARLFNFSTGNKLIMDANTNTTFQSDATGGFNVFLRAYGGATSTTDRPGLHLFHIGGVSGAPDEIGTGARLGTFTYGGRLNATDMFGVRLDGYADVVTGTNPTAVVRTSLRFATTEDAVYPTDVFKMNAYGGLEFMRGRTKAELDTLIGAGKLPNGSMYYCTDCTHASNPCTGSGTGAIMKRLNGASACN